MPPELVTRAPQSESGLETGWWTRYRQAAGSAGLSETALRVLDLDTDYILNRGILGVGEPDPGVGRWPNTRVRSGLVVGSVQSGKTASMLGVTAKALDSGVDIVLILSGTRKALWRQTFDRTIDQLDNWTPAESSQREQARILIPRPHLFTPTDADPSIGDRYSLHPSRVRRALEKKQPLISVVMKQAHHLLRLGRELEKSLDSTLRRREKPIHLLVIDDEADDGSILDAVVEAGLEFDSEQLKQIPRHVARLWTGAGSGPSTFHEKLYASYVAYTATPQANLLQADHNPLSPKDFAIALRTPFDRGGAEPPRDVTYNEPSGLSGYYTGGEIFYQQFEDESDSLCHTIPYPDRSHFDTREDFEREVEGQRMEQLGEALRAYFVSAAMRLVHSGKSLSEALELPPSPRGEVIDLSPDPSSMLIHPSAAIAEHDIAARQIALWSANFDPLNTPIEDSPATADNRPMLDPEGLEQRLCAEEPLWRSWFDRFEASRQKLDRTFPRNEFRANQQTEWERVKTTLRQEVFKHVKLSIINSRGRAEDRPMFSPQACGDREYLAAPDLLTIFVSGNVMSRGVTLEGLTTTVFLRSSSDPVADSQAQMQRWFGYRGSHLYWCRVFMYEDQLDLFRAYHENDLALRTALLRKMNEGNDEPPSPLVLQGRDFRATAKIANLRALPLCPGREPFVRLLGQGASASVGCDVLANLLDEGNWKSLEAEGSVRGIIWDQSLSLLQVAEILEQFRYPNHDPDPKGRNHRRWLDLAKHLNLADDEKPLFRPPGQETTEDAAQPDKCPFSIAAYLRFWSFALQYPVRGIWPTDDPRTPWSMIPLSMYAEDAPSFNVGVRFGGASEARHPRLARHGIRRVDRLGAEEGYLQATWGSQPGDGDRYLGDQFFDYYETGLAPPNGESKWRPRGHPGLLLFHVVKTSEDQEAVTVGLGLPLGGPDHFAALSSGGGAI